MGQKDSSQLVDASQELRQVCRASVQCRLTYSGVSSDSLIVGEGMVLNLSKDGCGIRGNQSVEKGMKLTLCLHLAGENPPLRLSEVRVVWANGEQFGVNSLDISACEQERLEEFLQSEFDQEKHVTFPVSFRMNLGKPITVE